MRYKFQIAGDHSVLVNFGNRIDNNISLTVRKLAEILESKNITGIEEVILGYTTLLINYNPFSISPKNLITIIDNVMEEIDFIQHEVQNIIEVPVLYGYEMGPDLADVARMNNLTEEEVIRIHTEPSYTVYFLGFSPGFPFLGGLNERIATPRLDNPRTTVHAGSVGIANNQTGVYPVNSPGGWRIIGHTPLPLFNPKSEQPFLLSPGDTIIFKSITKREYDEIISQLEGGGFDI